MSKKLIVVDRDNYPEYLKKFKELQGICIGGCIDPNHKIDKEHDAHAHAHFIDPHRGWICLRYKYQFREKFLMLHEMAHLIANKLSFIPDHGKEWRKVVKEIGGTFKSFHITQNKKNIWYPDFTHTKK